MGKCEEFLRFGAHVGRNICGTGCGYVGWTEGRSNHWKWGESLHVLDCWHTFHTGCTYPNLTNANWLLMQWSSLTSNVVMLRVVHGLPPDSNWFHQESYKGSAGPAPGCCRLVRLCQPQQMTA